jgi:hypothetical protein
MEFTWTMVLVMVAMCALMVGLMMFMCMRRMKHRMASGCCGSTLPPSNPSPRGTPAVL